MVLNSDFVKKKERKYRRLTVSIGSELLDAPWIILPQVAKFLFVSH
jgi:hypothetical protein